LLRTGDRAFKFVQTYSQIGHHRTGSVGDNRTVEWLADELNDQGANISFSTFDYVKFDYELTIVSGGELIRSMPLYYAFVGHKTIINPFFGSIDAHDDEAVILEQIAHLTNMAKTGRCDGLVLATQCPTGTLCAANTEYGIKFDFPVILVAENDLEKIDTHGASIDYFAGVHNAQARNIIARFQGPGSAPSMMITTPVSGWFNCAGERGCGLAVAMLLAKRLSHRFSIDLVMTSGHELGYIGGFDAAKKYSGTPDWILHLGSCLATLNSRLTAICSPTLETNTAIGKSLELFVDRLVIAAGDGDNWIGESNCWTTYGLPMLSISGINPLFHTPDDLPEVATTPKLLSDAIDTIYGAALALTNTKPDIL